MRLAVLIASGLAVVWCFVVGEFSAAMVLTGLAFGAVFVAVTRAGRGRRVALHTLPRRVVFLVAYILFVIWIVIRANLGLARRVLRRRPVEGPGIIRARLEDIGYAGMALEEHAMTLSPGQLVVDYGDDVATIYLHVVDVEESRRDLDTVGRRYRRLLKGILG
jgi:multisubunit Na+/H+ antiporter MnhE subunit